MHNSHYKSEINEYILIAQILQNPATLTAFIIKGVSGWIVSVIRSLWKQFAQCIVSYWECTVFYIWHATKCNFPVIHRHRTLGFNRKHSREITRERLSFSISCVIAQTSYGFAGFHCFRHLLICFQWSLKESFSHISCCWNRVRGNHFRIQKFLIHFCKTYIKSKVSLRYTRTGITVPFMEMHRAWVTLWHVLTWIN